MSGSPDKGRVIWGRAENVNQQEDSMTVALEITPELEARLRPLSGFGDERR